MILHHDTMAVIAPMALRQAPMRTATFFKKVDAEGNSLDDMDRASYHSVDSYCEVNPVREITPSIDETYFSFRLDMGKEDTDILEAFAAESGLLVYSEKGAYSVISEDSDTLDEIVSLLQMVKRTYSFEGDTLIINGSTYELFVLPTLLSKGSTFELTITPIKSLVLTGREVLVLSLPHWQEFMNTNPAFKADEVA